MPSSCKALHSSKRAAGACWGSVEQVVERQAFAGSAQAAWRGSNKNKDKTGDYKSAQAQWVLSL